MKINLVRRGDIEVFEATDSYYLKDELKALGWRFDPIRRSWWIAAHDYYEIAAFRHYMERDAKERCEILRRGVDERIERSRATTSDLQVPAPQGLNYFDYQRAGIEFLLSHPNAILADEMGLGKTVQIAGLINIDKSISKVLVLCPATLRRNWAAELSKWLVRKRNLSVIESKNNHVPADSEVLIISFDLLDKYNEILGSIHWDLLVCDEAHFVKKQSTKRSSAVFGVSPIEAERRLIRRHKTSLFEEEWRYAISSWSEKSQALEELMSESPEIAKDFVATQRREIKARRTIFSSGTPIPNRPIELWPILQRIDPTGLGQSYKSFATRYCAAFREYGRLNVSGWSNLDELEQRMRSTFLLRRKKSEVLRELPKKIYQMIEIPAVGTLAKLIERESAHWSTFTKACLAPMESDCPKFEELARVRAELAAAKIPHILEHIAALLERCEKLVVMAHHKSVITALARTYPDAAVISGETSAIDRMGEVERFQNAPNCRLFIGSISAAGTGITLTAASTILFVEQDWSPGVMQQAEDRLHRIGQRSPVTAQYLLVDGSLDAKMAKTQAAKSEVIEQALDGLSPA